MKIDDMLVFVIFAKDPSGTGSPLANNAAEKFALIITITIVQSNDIDKVFLKICKRCFLE